VSARTDQSDLDTAEKIVEKLIEKIDPINIIILSTGFWLGMRGWTPITSLIDFVTGQSMGQTMKEQTKTAAELKMTWLLGGIGDVLVYLLGGIGPDDKEKYDPTLIDKREETIMKGMIGMLEAYAITRPGFLSGIGEIVPL